LKPPNAPDTSITSEFDPREEDPMPTETKSRIGSRYKRFCDLTVPPGKNGEVR
jgi:hypothetical protein